MGGRESGVINRVWGGGSKETVCPPKKRHFTAIRIITNRSKRALKQHASRAFPLKWLLSLATKKNRALPGAGQTNERGGGTGGRELGEGRAGQGVVCGWRDCK